MTVRQRIMIVVACVLAATVSPRDAGGRDAQDTAPQPAPHFRVLLFAKTAGFRHGSIATGVETITELGPHHGFGADLTMDGADFNDENLARYKVVVFLNTTGDVLDAEQQEAFTRFIRGGGGYVGIHAAADTEYDWAWYGRLCGAYFSGHPRIQEATVRVEDDRHPATRGLPTSWVRTDEWYNYRATPRGEVHVLCSLDETTYEGGSMGDDHPIAWCHEFDGGRAFYTGMGHTNESYGEELFRKHLVGAIRWVAGVADAAVHTEEHGGGVEGRGGGL